MQTKLKVSYIAALFLILACKKDPKTTTTTTAENKSKQTVSSTPKEDIPFIWDAANVYFLLTDRFQNGDKENDKILKRTKKTGKLRGFEGGDLKGIIQKIEDGYFKNLGVNAIWFTPVVEQIHESVDEGTGNTYAYHGYWAKDWTAIDPNFGTMADLQQLVSVAHTNGIRILLDVVLNHTGPVTKTDSVWPDSWVRVGPKCTYKNQETAVTCTLVENLPDIKTENDSAVELPEFLIQKWKSEGRLETELDEIEVFFAQSGLKRSPKNYIIKWLTDYVRDLGVDGFRVDTVKHVEEGVWNVLAEQAKIAFAEWKKNHPDQVLDTNEFYLLGELYGYGIDGKRLYDFGNKKVDYFANGFDNLINFQFKYDADKLNYEQLFEKYDTALQTGLIGSSITNYITSHDDGSPFDKKRSKTFEAGTKLLLTPGVSQVYYGDETARSLIIEDTEGDATLRSSMNWEDLESEKTKALLSHWQKLGKFRKDHPSIGAGKHDMISETPYVFSRIYQKDGIVDKVVVALDLRKGTKTIKTGTVFKEGKKVKDVYSGKESVVKDGAVTLTSDFEIILLEEI